MSNDLQVLAWLALALAPLASPRADELRETPIGHEDREHWAFVPPVRPDVPTFAERGWARNPIDAFILTGLEESGVAHGPEADRPTLLRRLCFDLLGLPPTPDQLESFLADDRPDAYERLVDRLLASPRHGERWAQHWLDLARYADSDGYEYDGPRPNAWRYRDWVVEALNADMPYDRFVALQLAGDEIDPDNPSAFVATGFNRCYPDMVDQNDQGLRRQNALNDITETTSLVYLGLTIGCARCHDHKFDPIRQSDFYRLQAFFTPARFRDDYPVLPAPERRAFERRVATWESDRAAIESALIGLEAPARTLLAPGLPTNVVDERVILAARKADGERTPEETHILYQVLAKDRRAKPAILEWSVGPVLAPIRSLLLAEIKRLDRARPAPLPLARGIDETGSTSPPTFLLRRGDYGSNGPEVAPAFPAVLVAEDESASAGIQPLAGSTGRRSVLADWLIQPDHPLTARVIVNRLWQHHFGRGLVATPSDFGFLGTEPTHPDLLDWLATEFVACGWSLKAMHRLLVTSATYRQSSRPDPDAVRADPENILFGRTQRRRLDGEAIRDALLAVSDRLNPAMGGPGVFPDLPAELSRLNAKGSTTWPVSTRAADHVRRSLYVFVRRNLRYPFFEAFDRPDTNASCPQRPVTTIAPQALSLLNSDLAFVAAKALAAQVVRQAGPSPSERVDLAYRMALGRDPAIDERALALRFLDEGPESSMIGLCLALLNINEFVYID